LWGQQCRGLGQDDGTVGPGMTWVDNVVGSRTALGAQHRGLREDNIVVGSRTVSQAWGQCLRGRRHHWLGSGKIAARKGAQPWLGTTARRLQGGLGDGTEAPRRTRWCHELWGGRWQCGLQGNFWREILVAWRCEWKPPGIRVYKGHAMVYL
jgi:hypothetical protein